jgi:hypothetical protein
MTANAESYAAILADLRAERDALDRAIEIIERKMVAAGGVESASLSASPARTATGSNGTDLGDIRPDSFFGMVARDAAKKYLLIVKRPQKVNQIVKAMQEGGLSSRSKSLYSTVFTALVRNPDTFTNLGRQKGWGLAEWYGGRGSVTKRAKDSESSAAEKAKE